MAQGRKRRRQDGAAAGPAVDWQAGAAAPTRGGRPLWDFGAGPPGAALGPDAAAAAAEPNLEAELRRAELLAGLRRRYAEACRELLGLERPPADSVDRWLLEQLAQPKAPGEAAGARDPLLPRPRLGEGSRVLLRELLAEVPLRCPSRAFGPPAREALERYLAGARRWLARPGQADAAELVAGVGLLETWLREHGAKGARPRGPAECPFRRKLDELASDSGLSRRFRAAAEPSALRVVAVVSEEAERVSNEMLQFCRAPSASSTAVFLEEAAVPDGAVTLRFGTDAIRVSSMHLRKLRALYEVHQPRPGAGSPGKGDAAAWERAFLRRLYAMLRRYVTFIGLDPSEDGHRGGNMHAAAPETVFAWLGEEMGVRCEVFASPLNCYFSRFFSAFPDVDAAFGSCGSFFDVESLPEGSYEVGPPYTEEVLELTARKLLCLLQRAGGRALSFVLFGPDWEGASAYELLAGEDFAPFRRSRGGGAFVLARGREHHYISGVQFFADAGADAARRYYVVPHGTRVYVLQNDLGAEQFPLTQEKEDELLQSLRPLGAD